MASTLRSAGHIALIEALKSARKAAGLTQVDLAAKLGRPQSFVAKYENGERKVEVVELVRIALAIGCDPSFIIDAVIAAETRG